MDLKQIRKVTTFRQLHVVFEVKHMHFTLQLVMLFTTCIRRVIG